ncbi:MAG: carboxypeptidase-like regulatory domain-containing protein [Gemmatimonadaceae bacterium]|jgi:hypothetical protein|nr:carboxypeptidase-like regulatory domain-containing protein [Gemmatimonadaceae bacterium]
MRLSSIRHVVLGAVCIAAPAAAPLAAQTADIIRGRVTDDSSRIVAAATVFVTRGPDRAVQQTRTDSTGRYEVTFDPGTGDYLVAVSAPRLRSARRRVQRIGTERVLVADFVLSVDLATLAAVNVRAAKPERVRTAVGAMTQEVGSAERWVEGVAGQVSPTIAGNLTAITTMMPGITVGPGGLSMLGAPPGTNLTTLNGMALGSAVLPRAARVETRVTGATYDATRGGFAGANIDARIGAGDRQFQIAQSYVTLEPSALQRTDRVGEVLGARAQTVRASVGANGEAIRQTLTYNVAVDATRVSSDPATLSGTDPLPFTLMGVAVDSIARLRAASQRVGLPLSASGVPTSQQRDAVTLLARFDDIRDSTWQRSLTSIVNVSRDGAVGVGPLTAPASAGERRETGVGSMLTLGHFFGPGFSIYNVTKLNANLTRTAGDPYLALPRVSVLVPSDTSDIDGSTSVALGGDQAAQSTRRWTLEGSNETMRNVRGRRHLLRGIVWGRVDGSRQAGGGDVLGRYGFQSIDDLLAGRAASFSRTLVLPDRVGTTWNVAGALSHTYAPSRFFNIIYGARVEGSGLASALAANPAVDAALGVRTGVAPTRVHVSPRVGFTYFFNRSQRNGNGMSSNSIGRFYRYATGVLRGGIGEFRSLLLPEQVASVAARTGLPGSTLSLSCVGAAVPAPDWNRFLGDAATIPSQCIGGGGVLAERAPSVLLFDRGYDVPRSWRASLDFNTARWSLLMRVNALGSYSLGLPSTVDANFAGTPQGRLDFDGGRPLYVPFTAIDATSGAVSAAASRRSADFTRVGVLRSDLRGAAGQLTATVSTDIQADRWERWPFLSVSYTLQQARNQFRGFDGAAFGDPRAVEWAPALSDARHMLIGQVGFNRDRIGALTLALRAQSGLPFTPIVQGDIDGDGRSGDRAFIPDVGAGDVALSAQLAALRETGSVTARQCLRAYAGRVAARNGCRGPWTLTNQLQWEPPLPRAISRRAGVTLFFHNVLGGVDQLVHGRDGMRGWGSAPAIDPTLLVPRGFDAATRRFRYDVNPRFAETRPARTLTRDPFRVVLDVWINMSRNFDVQSLARAIEPVRVNRRWERRGEDSLTAFYLRNTTSLARVIIREADSLFLSQEQIVRLQVIDSVFGVQTRELYRPLARYLTAAGAVGISKAAVDTTKATEKAFWRMFWQTPERIDSVLTPMQRDLAPGLKGMLQRTAREREGARVFYGGAAVPFVHARAVPPKSP